jgi:hypothetical protein
MPTDPHVVTVYDESCDSDAFSSVLTLLCNQSPPDRDRIAAAFEEQTADVVDSGNQS